MPKPIQFYYGWVNVLMAAVAETATLPGRTHGLGLISKPLLEDLGISESTFAFANFWSTVLGAAFAVPMGFMIDRFGVRWLNAIAGKKTIANFDLESEGRVLGVTYRNSSRSNSQVARPNLHPARSTEARFSRAKLMTQKFETQFVFQYELAYPKVKFQVGLLPLCNFVIVAVATYDICLMVHYADSLPFMEINPPCRLLLGLDELTHVPSGASMSIQYISTFIAAKFAGTFVVICVLGLIDRFRRDFAVIVASSLACVQLALLKFLLMMDQPERQVKYWLQTLNKEFFRMAAA